MTAPQLTQCALRTLLDYDPETGVFIWRGRADVSASWNTRYAGKAAGYDWRASRRVTYRCIRIFDWPFFAHRLAFLYITGEWPRDEIDHRDGNGLNNRWSNLRPATKAQNAANVPLSRANSTGLKGASLCKHSGRYRATIRIDGRQRWLGYFDTAEEAHAAYCKAAVERSGEFARTA